MSAPKYYYLNPSNEPVGPLPLEQIERMIESGILGPSVKVSVAGSSVWQPATEVQSSVALPSPPSHPTPAPERVGNDDDRGVESMAVASMVAGLLSPILGLYDAFLGLLISVPALGLGVVSLGDSKGRHRSMAIIGMLAASVALLLSFFPLVTDTGEEVVEGPAREIERVLKEDRRIAAAAKSKHPDSNLERARYIATEAQQVNTFGCSPEFRNAYQGYINAWEAAIPYIAVDTPLTAFLEGLYWGYTGDPSALGLSGYQASVALQQVDAAYREVKAVAVACGARIPAG